MVVVVAVVVEAAVEVLVGVAGEPVETRAAPRRKAKGDEKEHQVQQPKSRLNRLWLMVAPVVGEVALEGKTKQRALVGHDGQLQA